MNIVDAEVAALFRSDRPEIDVFYGLTGAEIARVRLHGIVRQDRARAQEARR